MSNLIPETVKVPAHLMNAIGKPSALATALGGGLGGQDKKSPPRISIKGSRFRILEDGSEVVLDNTKLEIIIVGANPRCSKTYYAQQWDKDAEPAGPDCFSLDGVRPSADVTNPQNDLCASCPQNAWGSKTTPAGAPIKACSDQKRLAVLPAEDPRGSMYLLQVTPSALKGLNTYTKELWQRGFPPEIVKTVVSFDTDASFPRLKFTFGGFIDNETQSAVEGLFGSDKVKEITGEVDSETVGKQENVEEKPKPLLIKETPAPVAEPEPAPVEEVAPASARGFGGAKAKAKAPAQEPVAAPVADADPAMDKMTSDIENMLEGLDDE